MINDILNERQKTHGDFADNAQIAQLIKNAYLVGRYPVHYEVAESKDMIASKLARICSNGGINKDDWFDIIGYCTLVLRKLEREQTEMQERMG